MHKARCINQKQAIMKINYNGKEIEALHLVMKKKWAQYILAGRKTVEFRAFTPYYRSRLTIPENFEENNRRIQEADRTGVEPELLEDFKPIEAIHFSDYNNTWQLICRTDGIKLVGCDSGGARELRHDWGSHDLDDFNEVPDGQGPLAFAIHISGIIDHSGL